MRTQVAALAAGSLMAATVAVTVYNPTASASDSAPTLAQAADSIAWSACTDESLSAAKAECGMLSVPLDYTKPAGEKIKIAVSRVQHTAAQSQGVMLINPGGPGGSGLGFSAYLKSVMPEEVSSQY